jgi:hypothetical protein
MGQMSVDNIPLPAFARNTGTKVVIVAVEGFGGAIEAQYNPHTVQIDKSVGWKEDADMITYDKGQARTLTMELFFDVMELKSSSARRPLSQVLDTLSKMTLPTNTKGTDSERRPPVLKIGNGPVPGMLCVVETLGIKITAYHGDAHEPTRATVNLKLREVSWDEKRKLGTSPSGKMTRDANQQVDRPQDKLGYTSSSRALKIAEVDAKYDTE